MRKLIIFYNDLEFKRPYKKNFYTEIDEIAQNEFRYFQISVNIPEGFSIGGITIWCGGGTGGRIAGLYSGLSSTIYGFVYNTNVAITNLRVMADVLFIPS